MAKERILIVGGGFGGVKAALELADDERFSVTLLSDKPTLRYYPTLYHTATGGRKAGASIPLNRILGGKKVKLVQGEAVAINRQARTVTTRDKQVLPYDSVIFALGVRQNYFGIKGLEKYSYGVKSTSDALRLKAHLHKQLFDQRKVELNYVVVGGGPTGIELAGALPAYLNEIMAKHGIKRRRVHVDLVEAAPRVLPTLPKDVSKMVQRRLRHLGVRLHLGKMVQAETADELIVSGKPIRCHTVIWTAGVANHPFFAANKFLLMGNGKVATNVYLQAEPNIFVIGDNANTPYSGMAETAVADGIFIAQNLKRRASGQDMKSYNARRPTTVIPVGPDWAVMVRGKFRLYGRPAWWLRSAADFVAFNDYEPLFEASKQWLISFDGEEECSVCLSATAA